MYWLQPPPYLRRIGAITLIVAAMLWDLRAGRSEQFPVASRFIAAGTAITEADLAWVAIPVDSFEAPDLTEAVAARHIEPGEPISPLALTHAAPAPADWWTVPIAIGQLASPGDEVMLVVADPPLTAYGVVVAPQRGDRYSLDFRPASVAVPPEAAAPVAAAERSGTLITAARTGVVQR